VRWNFIEINPLIENPRIHGDESWYRRGKSACFDLKSPDHVKVGFHLAKPFILHITLRVISSIGIFSEILAKTTLRDGRRKPSSYPFSLSSFRRRAFAITLLPNSDEWMSRNDGRSTYIYIYADDKEEKRCRFYLFFQERNCKPSEYFHEKFPFPPRDRSNNLIAVHHRFASADKFRRFMQPRSLKSASLLVTIRNQVTTIARHLRLFPRDI